MQVETFALGELQENAYLVLENGISVVIDPGDGPKRLVKRIEKSGTALAAILLTHAHWDHVAGVGELKDRFEAPIYLHEADKFLYERVPAQAEYFGFRAGPQPPLDRAVNDGQVIEAGPLRFEVLHTPGHTPGGVCYSIGDIVFVGDTVFAGGIGRTDLPGASHEQLIRSIRQKILTLDDAVTLYPGHGPPTTVGAERASNPFLA